MSGIINSIIQFLINPIISAISTILLVIISIIQIYDRFLRPMREKNEKQSKISEDQYLRIKEQIQKNYDDIIKENLFESNLVIGRVSQNIDKKIEYKLCEFQLQYDLCSDIFDGLLNTMKYNIYKNISLYFPNSSNNHPELISLLSRDDFIRKIIEEDNLSIYCLREIDFNTHHQIIGILNNTNEEQKLDEFLNNINIIMKNDKIINRFKVEKKKLILMNNELMDALNKKIKNST